MGAACRRPAAVTLQTVSGTLNLNIGTADLGVQPGHWCESAPRPAARRHSCRVTGFGRRQRSLSRCRRRSADSITVTLNSAVSWRLELASGTKQTIADLRRGLVTGVAITAGSTVLDLLLPQPHGSVPIRLAAGASQFLLSVPHGSAVRVTAAKGAGQVSLEGAKHVAVRNGSVFTTPGWAAGTAGFDIDATAGAARLTVTARAS